MHNEVPQYMYISDLLPYPDNSPPRQFPTVQVLVLTSWWVVLFRSSGPNGELSWWGILLGIVGPVGNGWALFLSCGELSLVGSCPRTIFSISTNLLTTCIHLTGLHWTFQIHIRRLETIAPKLWNSILRTLANTTSTSQFKKHLKSLICLFKLV